MGGGGALRGHSRCDTECFVLQVLYLEQLLTTGGGWQDQIGGLKGGIYLGLSEAKLPLYVEPVDLKISQQKIQDFNSRLMLIYTGKTRLARNLLQVRCLDPICLSVHFSSRCFLHAGESPHSVHHISEISLVAFETVPVLV